MNESIGCEPSYAIVDRMYRINSCAKCASNYMYEYPLVVDEMRHGVRDIAVNVRGFAVRIEQTIYTRKNRCLNIFRRLRLKA